jgi:hypothetical protein
MRTAATKTNQRRFYIITAAVLIAILGVAAIIVVDTEYSYVKIEVLGNSATSFTISYDSTSTNLTPSENATVEVLPHANVTVTASVSPPYSVLKWDVSGATTSQKGANTIQFVTGQGGSVILIALELTRNSSA